MMAAPARLRYGSFAFQMHEAVVGIQVVDHEAVRRSIPVTGGANVRGGHRLTMRIARSPEECLLGSQFKAGLDLAGLARDWRESRRHHQSGLPLNLGHRRIRGQPGPEERQRQIREPSLQRPRRKFRRIGGVFPQSLSVNCPCS